jgi:hypothetical protein
MFKQFYEIESIESILGKMNLAFRKLVLKRVIFFLIRSPKKQQKGKNFFFFFTRYNLFSN